MYFMSVYIIPTFGLSYVDVKVDKYTETGNGLNRTVSERKTTRTSGTAGLKVKYLLDMVSVQLMPEVHADIDYALSSKNSDTKVLIVDGLDPISTPAQELTKGYYNVGASLKAQQEDMYEISFGYDFRFAKKFQSHTGTLRLRVDL